MITFISHVSPKRIKQKISPRLLRTMSDRVEDRAGTPIEEGDTVFTKFRGGKREGEVSVPQLYTAHCMATKTQVGV